MVNFKKGIIFINLLLATLFLYSQESPTSTEVLNYYIACADNDLKKVRSFLEKYPNSVDIELFDDNPAYQNNNLAYVKFANYLIMTGKALPFKDDDEEKEWTKNYKRYPINIVSRYGNIEILRELIKYKADLNLREENSETPLLVAASNGHLDVVKELLQQGVDINQKNNNNTNALMRASQNGHLEVVIELLKNGANINDKNIDGYTALTCACINGNCKIVHELINHKADINSKTNEGFTNLMAAAESGNVDVELFEISIDNSIVKTDSTRIIKKSRVVECSY